MNGTFPSNLIPNVSLAFEPAVAFYPVATFPVDPLNYNQWVGYVFFVIIILLVVILLSSCAVTMCCCFCCIRCCQGFGGMRPTKKFKQGYHDKDRIIAMIPYFLNCLVITLATLVGLALMITFSVGVSSMAVASHTLVENALSKFFGLTDELQTKTSRASSNFQANIIPTVLNYIDFSTNFQNVRSLANSAMGNVNGLGQQLSLIQSNYSIAMEKLQAFAARPELSSSFDMSQFPTGLNLTIDTSVATTAFSTVDSAIATAEQYIADAPTFVTQTLNNTLNGISTAVNSIANTMKQTIPMDAINSTIAQYLPMSARQSIRDAAIGAEWLKGGVFFIFFFTAFQCAWIGLLCIGCHIKCKTCVCCLWFNSCVIFTLSIAYFVIFFVQLFGFIIINDVCQQGPGAFQRADSKYISSVYLPYGINLAKQSAGTYGDYIHWDSISSLNASSIASGLLQCRGNQTALEAMNINTRRLLNTQSIEGMVKDQISQSVGSNLNQTFDDLTNRISDFSIDTSQYPIDTFQVNISSIINQVYNLTNEIDLSKFGYNATKLNETVDEFNSFLQNNNIPLYFTIQNISSLNSSDPAFSSLPPQEQQYIQDVEADVQEFTQKFSEAMELIAGVQYNATIFINALRNISAVLDMTSNTLTELSQLPSQAMQLVQQMRTAVQDKIDNLGVLIDAVNNDLGTFINDAAGVTECNFAGSFARNIVNNVCGPITSSIGGLAIINLILALLLLLLFPCACNAAKKATWRWKPIIEKDTTVVQTTSVVSTTNLPLIEETVLVHEYVPISPSGEYYSNAQSVILPVEEQVHSKEETITHQQRKSVRWMQEDVMEQLPEQGQTEQPSVEMKDFLPSAEMYPPLDELKDSTRVSINMNYMPSADMYPPIDDEPNVPPIVISPPTMYPHVEPAVFQSEEEFLQKEQYTAIGEEEEIESAESSESSTSTGINLVHTDEEEEGEHQAPVEDEIPPPPPPPPFM